MDPALEIIKQAYMDDYRGKFSDLLQQQGPEMKDPSKDTRLETSVEGDVPRKPIYDADPIVNPHETDLTGNALVESHEAVTPEEIPTGNPVRDVLNPGEYRDGGHRLVDNLQSYKDMVDPHSADYVQGYKNLYKEGGKKEYLKKPKPPKIMSNISISPEGIGIQGQKNLQLGEKTNLQLSAQKPLLTTGTNPELIEGHGQMQSTINQQIGNKTNFRMSTILSQGQSPIYDASLNTHGKAGSLGVKGTYNRDAGYYLGAKGKLNLHKNLSLNAGVEYKPDESGKMNLKPSVGFKYTKRF
jgi:hypothetical protein